MKAHLTKRFVENLETPDTRLWVTDDQTRGLTLLATPTGTKSWYLIRKFRGKVDRNYLGRYPELSLQEAKRRSRELQLQYDQGISPQEERSRQRSMPTLNEFALHYYEQHLKPHTKHPERNHQDYLRYVAPVFGDLRLDEIRRADIREHMHVIAENLGHPRTANIARGVIRRIINHAIALEYLGGPNPAEHIRGYPEPARSRVLTPEELPRFHAALAEEANLTVQHAILMLLYTGARKSNVFAMHWGDIDFERCLWTIPDTKNGDSHTVALTREALGVLEARKPRTSVYVFPGAGKSGHLTDIKGAWRRLLDSAGIDNLWIHDLRRTVGSFMANLGANQVQISQQLGHRDLQSAKAYVYPNVDFVRPFTEQVTSYLSPESN